MNSSQERWQEEDEISRKHARAPYKVVVEDFCNGEPFVQQGTPLAQLGFEKRTCGQILHKDGDTEVVCGKEFIIKKDSPSHRCPEHAHVSVEFPPVKYLPGM